MTNYDQLALRIRSGPLLPHPHGTKRDDGSVAEAVSESAERILEERITQLSDELGSLLEVRQQPPGEGSDG